MNGSFTVSGLRCELLVEPRGLETRAPRFSWSLSHPRRAQFQSAYQVLVATSHERLETDTPDMWDSGVVATSASANVEYSGQALASGNVYFWKVKAWDSADVASAYSPAASFQMGVLEPGSWGEAEWIGPPVGFPSQPLLRKGFTVSGAVLSACAFISGLGYHELYLNGTKVGDHVLDPGWTDYDKRVLYVTHDLLPYLRPGANAVGVMLGNGWYCTPRWNGEPKVLLRIRIRYADGTTADVVTGEDAGWQALPGPVVADSLYDGETYDARLEQPGWSSPPAGSPGADQAPWVPAVRVAAPAGALTSQTMEPIKVVQTLQPVALTNPKPGVFVYDMGQNMAGWAQLGVRGPRGQVVTMRFAETLYPDGTVNAENLRAAKCIDTYTLAGHASGETYAPRFTYHGFRYVQLEGFPGTPSTSAIAGCVVRSAVEAVGSFECSSPLLNKLHRNVQWTEAGNLHSVPTDCPQRDERQGWLNDMTARSEEAPYNFGMAALYSKWVTDIADTQDDTGAVADTAPFVWGQRPADPVCSSLLLVPWYLYQHYGDVRVLKEHYEEMKRWVGCLESRTKEGVVDFSHYGDWASPITSCTSKDEAHSAITPGVLVSTAFLYYDMVLLARIARVLGHAADADTYAERARHAAEGFNDAFFSAECGHYASGSQGSNALALYLGLVPAQHLASVVASLVRDVVEAQDYHVTTGNICTRFIMDVLTDAGHIDAAYALATQTTYPSWGYMIENGATTVWERWEYATGGAMNSHNHPMYAAVGAWFYRCLAGIRPDPSGPGFARTIIKPYFPRGLGYVTASLQTLRGTVRSRWTRHDAIELAVSVPGNSEAEVWLPRAMAPVALYEADELLGEAGGTGGEAAPGSLHARLEGEYLVVTVGSGDYRFVCQAG